MQGKTAGSVEQGSCLKASAGELDDRGRPAPLFPKLVPRRNAPREAVAAHQRGRLHAAMIEACARHGYAEATVRELAALAGVSTKALYVHFETKEGCFFATYDLVVRQAMGRISAAYRGDAAGEEPDWAGGLCRAFDAFAAELVQRPAASRLALVDILAAPPEALSRIERTESLFATMIATSLAQAPDEAAIPPPTLRALIGGLWFVARTRLREGRPQSIATAGIELMEWLLLYRTAADSRLLTGRRTVRPVSSARPNDVPRTARGRMLRAAADVVAQSGYSALSPPHVADLAGVAEDAFHAQFAGPRDCFLAMLESSSARVLADILRESEGARTWAGSVCRAVEALFLRLAADEALARAAFLDVFSAGAEGAERHTAIMRGFARSLMRRAPPDQRPTQLVAEAIVGAVWTIAHRYAARGRMELLPSSAARATFVTLAPIVGAEAALAAIREEFGPPRKKI